MRFATGAFKYVAGVGILAIPGLFVSPVVGIGLVVLCGGILWFYRDPNRQIPSDGLVAPADGRVRRIARENGRVRVSIFMRVTDVHVNRSVLDGTVESIRRESGGHLPAFLSKSSRNERVEIELDSHELTLITGIVARRITPYVEEDETVMRGQRIGHIAFGSRVDVRLPEAVSRKEIRVSEGDRVRAGESIIADAL